MPFRLCFCGKFFVDDEPFVGEGNALFFEIFPLLVLDDDFDVRDEGVERIHDFAYLVEIASVNRLFRHCGICGEHESAVDETDGFELLNPDFVAYRLHSF